MSMLGCSAQVACVELVSKIFYIVGLTSVAYRNVDLSNFPPAEDLTVLMCIQRSYGQPSSISVGCEKGPNRQYTSRFLEPLQSDYGRRITKMCLLDIPYITEDDLVSTFSQCTLLTELDIHCGEEISIDFVFRAMASHCPLLEVLAYRTEAEPSTYGVAIDDDALRTFVEKCPRVKGLGLLSVMASDSQILVIIEGFKTLTRLNLSSSRGFTGSFLCGIQINGLELQKLRLEACETLSEESLSAFVLELCDRDYFPNLKLLVVKGKFGMTSLREGFEARIALDDLKKSRPKMTIDMRFELESEALCEYMPGSEFGLDGQEEGFNGDMMDGQHVGFVDGNMMDGQQDGFDGVDLDGDMMDAQHEGFDGVDLDGDMMDGQQEGFDGVALDGEMMDGQEDGQEDYWLDEDEWYYDWRTFEDRKRKKYFHWCIMEKKNGEPL